MTQSGLIEVEDKMIQSSQLYCIVVYWGDLISSLMDYFGAGDMATQSSAKQSKKVPEREPSCAAKGLIQIKKLI